MGSRGSIRAAFLLALAACHDPVTAPDASTPGDVPDAGVSHDGEPRDAAPRADAGADAREEPDARQEADAEPRDAASADAGAELHLALTPNALRATSGRTATVAVTLDADPGRDVTVDVEGAAFAVPTPTELRFPRTAWGVPQQVAIALLDPEDCDGSDAVVRFTERAGAARAELPVRVLSALGRQVITADPLSISLVEGSTAAADFALACRPATTTTVTLVPGDPAAARVIPERFVATPADWNRPRRITFEGLEDPDAIDSTVDMLATAIGLGSRLVRVNVLDDEGPLRLFRAPAGLRLREGERGTLWIRLTAPPPGDVTVRVESNDTTAADVSPDALLFTPAAWDLLQPVAVDAVQDPDRMTERVSLTITAPGFRALIVIAVITDDDA